MDYENASVVEIVESMLQTLHSMQKICGNYAAKSVPETVTMVLSDWAVEELFLLNQVGTVDAYFRRFQSLKSLAHSDFPEEFYTSLFINGLQTRVRTYIQQFSPTFVIDAYELSCIFEFERQSTFKITNSDVAKCGTDNDLHMHDNEHNAAVSKCEVPIPAMVVISKTLDIDHSMRESSASISAVVATCYPIMNDYGLVGCCNKNAIVQHDAGIALVGRLAQFRTIDKSIVTTTMQFNCIFPDPVFDPLLLSFDLGRQEAVSKEVVLIVAKRTVHSIGNNTIIGCKIHSASANLYEPVLGFEYVDVVLCSLGPRYADDNWCCSKFKHGDLWLDREYLFGTACVLTRGSDVLIVTVQAPFIDPSVLPSLEQVSATGSYLYTQCDWSCDTESKISISDPVVPLDVTAFATVLEVGVIDVSPRVYYEQGWSYFGGMGSTLVMLQNRDVAVVAMHCNVCQRVPEDNNSSIVSTRAFHSLLTPLNGNQFVRHTFPCSNQFTDVALFSTACVGTLDIGADILSRDLHVLGISGWPPPVSLISDYGANTILNYIPVLVSQQQQQWRPPALGIKHNHPGTIFAVISLSAVRRCITCFDPGIQFFPGFSIQVAQNFVSIHILTDLFYNGAFGEFTLVGLAILVSFCSKLNGCQGIFSIPNSLWVLGESNARNRIPVVLLCTKALHYMAWTYAKCGGMVGHNIMQACHPLFQFVGVHLITQFSLQHLAEYHQHIFSGFEILSAADIAWSPGPLCVGMANYGDTYLEGMSLPPSVPLCLQSMLQSRLQLKHLAYSLLPLSRLQLLCIMLQRTSRLALSVPTNLLLFLLQQMLPVCGTYQVINMAVLSDILVAPCGIACPSMAQDTIMDKGGTNYAVSFLLYAPSWRQKYFLSFNCCIAILPALASLPISCSPKGSTALKGDSLCGFGHTLYTVKCNLCTYSTCYLHLYLSAILGSRCRISAAFCFVPVHAFAQFSVPDFSYI